MSKKILIMGANPETIPLIEAAREMGMYVYVTDHDPSAPAKVYADEALNIDGFDVVGIAEFVKSNAVDGVLVGVADRLIEPYRQVCQMANLPCYTDQLQSQVLTDKAEFNRWCKNHEIQTIPSYAWHEITSRVNHDTLDYPVLVKPTDANSGKGMSVARTIADLKLAVEKASAMSATKQVLIERYMECDDVLLYYSFENGTCHLSAMGDRFTNRTQGALAPVCNGALYPSKHLELYTKKHHSNFLRLFDDLGLQNGVLLISAFIDGENLYVYDPGFRFQGEGMNHHLKSINHIDQYAMLLNYAVTGEVDSKDSGLSGNDPGFGGKTAATLWLLLKEGEIHMVEGLSSVKDHPHVHKVIQRLDVGDTVESNMIGSEAQVFARIYLAADERADVGDAIAKICEVVRVSDKEGHDMLLSQPDPWWQSS